MSSKICSAKRCRTLFWERVKTFTVTTPPPLGAVLDECDNVRRIALYRCGSPGRGPALPKEADTRRPRSPGNNSRRSVTHHRTWDAAPADPWLTPSFTSHVPHKGQDWLLSPRAHDKRVNHHGGVVIVVVVVVVVGCLSSQANEMHPITMAEHVESDSRRPCHLGLDVHMDGGRKCRISTAKIPSSDLEHLGDERI